MKLLTQVNGVVFEKDEVESFCNLSMFLKNYNKIYGKIIKTEDVMMDEGVLSFMSFMFDVGDIFSEIINSELWISNDIMYYLLPNYFFKVTHLKSKNDNLIITHDFDSAIKTCLTGISDEILFHLISKGEKEKKTSGQKTYVIYDFGTDLYKIGKSINPKQRVKALGISSDKLVLTLICDENVESKLHRKFERKNKFNEWYKLNADDLLELIEIYNFRKA